jgi:hypothetical protein
VSWRYDFLCASASPCLCVESFSWLSVNPRKEFNKW